MSTPKKMSTSAYIKLTSKNAKAFHPYEQSSLVFKADDGSEILTTFKVRYTIPFDSVMKFVNEVVGTCFDDETGRYLPEARDFAIKKNIIEHYTDIVLPDDVSLQYDIIYNGNIVQALAKQEAVSEAQVFEISEAIDRKIQYLQNSFSSANMLMVNQIISKMDDVASQFSKIFEGIDIGEATRVMSAISAPDQEVSDKIAAAVLRLHSNDTVDAPIKVLEPVVVNGGSTVIKREPRVKAVMQELK